VKNTEPAISLLVIMCLIYLSNGTSSTVFSISEDNLVFVGNNEELDYSTDVEVWFVPATKKAYGRICFGWRQFMCFRIAEGGMNDQGLFFDWASCPKSKPPIFPGKEMLLRHCINDRILAECATVDEAIRWLKRYTIITNSHIMLADKGGNSAVIEWVDSELSVINKKGTYQVMNNFWLSRPELGEFPCDEYGLTVKMLEERVDLSIEYIVSTLKLVSIYKQISGKVIGTIYSNVYDLVNGDVYTYYKLDYENSVIFNLEKELEKGRRIFALESLFTNH